MKQHLSWSEIGMSRTEILFFLTISLVFPVITDFEINFYERTGSSASDLLAERLVYGILNMVPYWIFYKIVIPYLFAKRYFLFISFVALFLLFLTIYMKYEHWLVSRLSFLPQSTIGSAEKWFQYSPKFFRFSVVFVFREMLMFTALAYFLRSSTQEKQMQTLREKHLQAELNYLKIQLQPHFFFNTLNNIYSLALERSKKTAPLIAKHAEMMRYILYHSTRQTVAINQEIEFLMNYAEVERLRYTRNADIHFETQSIDNSAVIEPLLLLPFVENAFKHGLREEFEKGFVHIVICMMETELIMEVRNSIPATSPWPNARKGIGLKNAMARLNALYPTHQLNIRQDEKTYDISLTLPLLKHG